MSVPIEITVKMRPATAIVLWQICNTFATLPGLPPVGRVRAYQLALQFHQLARGDIPSWADLSDARKDVLCAGALDEHEPRTSYRVLTYRVEFRDFSGRPLEDGRPSELIASSPWALLAAAVAAGHRLPAGLTQWFREAANGDSANMLDRENGVRVHAEVRTPVSAAANV